MPPYRTTLMKQATTKKESPPPSSMAHVGGGGGVPGAGGPHGDGKKPAGLSVRVVVRVRPVTETDTTSSCTSLVVEPDGLHVSLTPAASGAAGGNDKRAGHKYQFDAALAEDASQEDVYRAAGVQQLVQAAAAGYHATVFAYGQTGSGKTYTMEGFKYTSSAAAGTPKQRSGGGVPPAAAAAPMADFDATPQQQLGVTPRAVRALFASLGSNTERRFSVRCSYVQIYKEQAYDLLNPTSIMLNSVGGPGATMGGSQQHQQQKGQGGGAGGPGQQQGLPGALRMRWSKADDFYLENLFKVECASADEALTLFRSGVANKVMASHKLNASSSRSHCLFTLYIDSSPLASPNEVISSRLTLVDLAGSERGSTVGATEGRLRDESVAINKSLFTLRQVITCLAANSSKEAQQAAQQLAQQVAGQPAGQPAANHNSSNAPKLPPYRDSKLTSLLKNSLGGTAMTLMLACVAPVDTFYEENLSTLEYARQAARITNHVALNEDAKTKLIRELRAEVAFLRQQLAAVQGPGAAGLVAPMDGHPPGYGGQQKPGPTGAAGGNNRANVRAGGPTGGPGAGGPGPQPGAGMLQLAQAGGASVEELRQRLLESTQHDIGIMVIKLLDAINLVQSLSSVNQQLRTAYDQVSKHSEDLRVENDSLMIENAAVRDRLSFIEGVAGMSTANKSNSVGGAEEGSGGGSGGGAGTGPPTPSGAPAVYTAGAAALIELQELRRENALLHERLKTRSAPPGSGGPAVGLGGPLLGAGASTAGSQSGRFARQQQQSMTRLAGGSNGAYVSGSPMRGGPPALTPFTPAALRQAVTAPGQQQHQHQQPLGPPPPLPSHLSVQTTPGVQGVQGLHLPAPGPRRLSPGRIGGQDPLLAPIAFQGQGPGQQPPFQAPSPLALPGHNNPGQQGQGSTPLQSPAAVQSPGPGGQGQGQGQHQNQGPGQPQQAPAGHGRRRTSDPVRESLPLAAASSPARVPGPSISLPMDGAPNSAGPSGAGGEGGGGGQGQQGAGAAAGRGAGVRSSSNGSLAALAGAHGAALSPAAQQALARAGMHASHSGGALVTDPPPSPGAMMRMRVSVDGAGRASDGGARVAAALVNGGPRAVAGGAGGGSGGGANEHGAKLAQLMSERNALSRTRMLAADAPAAPPPAPGLLAGELVPPPLE